jgi:WD40 repeat protein
VNTKQKFNLLILLMYFFLSCFLYSQSDSIITLEAKGSFLLASIDYSLDGTRIAAGYSSRIIIWDAIKGNPIDTMDYAYCSYNLTVRYSSDGTMLASTCDSTPTIWEPNTGKLLETYRGQHSVIETVAFSNDNKKIITSSDSTVAIWNVNSNILFQRFKAHNYVKYYTSSCLDAVFSLDDSKIVSCGRDSVIRIWDANTYSLLKTIKGHNGAVTSLAISPDGSKVVSSSEDSTIKLWDLNTGMLIRTFYGHNGQVLSVVFSPNGTKILSGSIDKTVKLWDAASGKLLHTFVGHNREVVRVRYSPDSLRVASVGYGGNKIIIWKVPDITDVVEQIYLPIEDLIISPNPATDYIEITVNNLVLQGVDGVGTDFILKDAVKVYDVLGNVVLTLTPVLSLKGEGVKINVSGLPKGVYFVRVGRRTSKFLKM